MSYESIYPRTPVGAIEIKTLPARMTLVASAPGDAFDDRGSAFLKLFAFIIGAVWSPFYGAMAVALTFAPGASLTRLMCIGLPLALAGLALSWFTLSSARHGYAREFAGYPLHLEALWVPFVLVVLVLGVHEWQPAWPVLAIITLSAPAVTALTLLLRRAAVVGL